MKETLWIIARKYYGNNPTNAQVNAIKAANGLPQDGTVKPGMVLRIP